MYANVTYVVYVIAIHNHSAKSKKKIFKTTKNLHQSSFIAANFTKISESHSVYS